MKRRYRRRRVNLVQITPGAGGMYCGNCFRDNALVAALRRQGHDTVMAARQIDGDAVSHVLFVGVRINFRKHSAAKACSCQHIQRLGGDGQRSQRLIRHQQRLGFD